jgi:hypothetical protein
MQFSQPLPAAAQSAYAELLEVSRGQDITRSVGNLSGSFNRKLVKGVPYWYYQFRDSAGAATRQVFVGPESERLQALIAESRTKDDRPLDSMAKAAMALGCAAATPAHFRIVRRLNEIGFYGAGGVLVGAHAFLTYGNALGVAWGDIGRTQDIDFAHSGRNVSLALPTTLHVQARDAITRLEEGFLPVPGFRPRDRTATFVSKIDKQLRVDFLTPMVGGKDEAFEHEALGVALHPMRFIEFVLEDLQQAAVLSAIGAVVVNVPDPARFALHKLLVFAERRTSNPAKARKDLRQAAALIEVLSEFRRDDLLVLWKDLLARGPGWRDRAKKAMTALESLAPDLPALVPMKKAAAKATSPARGRAR